MRGKYPTIMRDLYSGENIGGEKLTVAQKELLEISKSFRNMSANAAVWNIDKEDTRQGEVNEGNYYAASLEEFFVNQTGGNVLRALSTAINNAIEYNRALIITSMLPVAPSVRVWPPGWGRALKGEEQ